MTTLYALTNAAAASSKKKRKANVAIDPVADAIKYSVNEATHLALWLADFEDDGQEFGEAAFASLPKEYQWFRTERGFPDTAIARVMATHWVVAMNTGYYMQGQDPGTAKMVGESALIDDLPTFDPRLPGTSSPPLPGDAQ